MKHSFVPTTLALLCSLAGQAQVKIGGTPVAPVPSAVLELDGGSSRGLLLPRMRKIDMDAIVDPAEGLTIYATDEQAVYLRKSLIWEKQAPFNLRYDAVTNSPDYLLRIENTNVGGLAHAIVGASNGGTAIMGTSSNGFGIEGYSSGTGTAGRFSSTIGGKALIVQSGRTGIGATAPAALLHINGASESGTTIIIDDNDDPTIQFRKAGINKSYIKQEGNNLVFRPNDQNSSGKVILQSYNNGGWLFVDAAGNTSLGVDPAGFTGTPYNSRMNIRASSGVNLSLDAASDNATGPALSFVNKSGPNTTTELGSIEANNTGIKMISPGKTSFDGNSDWIWQTPGSFQTLMELRRYPNSGDLVVSGKLGIGADFTYLHYEPVAALDINIVAGYNGSTSEAISVAGIDPIIRMKNNSVEKGFLQLVGTDVKIGTVATNDAGRFIIRTNGLDKMWVDSVGYVTIGGKTGPTINGVYKFAVKGKIAATEFNVVGAGSWPDYVFADDYNLRSLEETETFIKANKHLPNMPAASVVEKEGFALGDMQKRMMEKIEELTLHLIAADKEIQLLKKQMAERK